jgi:AmmeMemoRadiSam system protein B
MAASRVRKPAVAGRWYPGDRPGLVREVDACLDAVAPRDRLGRLVALVSPHAGLRYSGQVAAEAWALLRGRRGLTVVLVGPSHRVAFEGISVYDRGAFETPLGISRVAEDVAAALQRAHPRITADPWPHREEHSLEMQLPFLQRVAPDARIVPVLLGTQDRAEVDTLAAALPGALAGKDAVLVASTDLSHYHPAERASVLDARVTECVARLDPDALMDRLESYRGHACGGGALVSVMRAARTLGATSGEVLRYADSGDAGGRDKTRVVGYLAAALTAAEAA